MYFSQIGVLFYSSLRHFFMLVRLVVNYFVSVQHFAVAGMSGLQPILVPDGSPTLILLSHSM